MEYVSLHDVFNLAYKLPRTQRAKLIVCLACELAVGASPEEQYPTLAGARAEVLP